MRSPFDRHLGWFCKEKDVSLRVYIFFLFLLLDKKNGEGHNV